MRLRNIHLLVLCMFVLLIVNIASAHEVDHYFHYHTGDDCSVPGLTLISSADVLDSGQSVTLTVSVPYSEEFYNYTYLNITSGSILQTFSNVPDPSSSFTFSSSSTAQNSTFKYGMSVTDDDNVTCSPNNVTIVVNPALGKPTLSPTNLTIVSGQNVMLNVSVSGGTPPYSFMWYSGPSANCTQDSLVEKTSHQYYIASTASTAYFCVKVTDSATMRSSLYSDPDLITVMPNSTSSTTTSTISTSSTTTICPGSSSTTTSTISTSTSTIPTTTIPETTTSTISTSTSTIPTTTIPETTTSTTSTSTSTSTMSTASTTVSGGGNFGGGVQDSTGEGTGGGNAGGGIQCSTVGPSGHMPTVVQYIDDSNIGYRILNFSNRDSTDLLYDTTFTVVENFITPTSAGISINCNSYTLPLNVSTLFLNTSNYSYFTRLINISYLPALKSITLLVYRHPNMVPPMTTTVETTTTINTTTTLPQTTIFQPTTTVTQVSAPGSLGPALIGTGIAIVIAIVIGIAYSRRNKEKRPKGHADKSDSSAK